MKTQIKSAAKFDASLASGTFGGAHDAECYIAALCVAKFDLLCRCAMRFCAATVESAFALVRAIGVSLGNGRIGGVHESHLITSLYIICSALEMCELRVYLERLVAYMQM